MTPSVAARGNHQADLADSTRAFKTIRPSHTAAFPTFAAIRKGGFKFIQPRRSCAKRIHLVILQSLGDTTFFKRAVQTDTQSL